MSALWVRNKGRAGEVVNLGHEVDLHKVAIADIGVTYCGGVDISGAAKEGAPTGSPTVMSTGRQRGGD